MYVLLKKIATLNEVFKFTASEFVLQMFLSLDASNRTSCQDQDQDWYVAGAFTGYRDACMCRYVSVLIV